MGQLCEAASNTNKEYGIDGVPVTSTESALKKSGKDKPLQDQMEIENAANHEKDDDQMEEEEHGQGLLQVPQVGHEDVSVSANKMINVESPHDISFNSKNDSSLQNGNHRMRDITPETATLFGQRYYLDFDQFEADLKKYSEGMVYEDNVFPPNDASIIDPNDIIDDLQDLGPVDWKRACDIPALVDKDGKQHIFQGEIEPNDIQQGQIGNCYFLSSLAALAEFPDRICKMFVQQETQENGMYAAFMYKNGIKMIVAVDDKFPCKGDQVVFARSNGQELWVLLLEKMWAKLHGCYDRIAGGLEYETIRDLTGAPGYFYKGIDDGTFEKIFKYDQMNYMMGCSMSDTYDQEEAAKQGIVAGHAYTLLSVAKLMDNNNQEHKLVKLRNPWGSGEWNGRWSDKSAEWTPELRREIGFDGDHDDGIFWMDFNDFKEIFGFWSVNKYIDGGKFSHTMVQHQCTEEEFSARYSTSKYHLFRIVTTKQGFHTFAVSQFGNRLLPRSAKYKYANTVVYLVKENPEHPNTFQECTHIDAKVSRQDRDVYIEVEKLAGGAYWLFVELEWQATSHKCLNGYLNFSVNCYGGGDVYFSQDLSNNHDKVDVLSSILHAYCLHHHEQGDGVVRCDQPNGMMIWEETNYWETGYNFKLVHNTTEDKVLVLCHTHLDFQNGLIVKPLGDKDYYKVSRSQYAFSVQPKSKLGVFTKPYKGFKRGGQAHTPLVIDLENYEADALQYYQTHYDRYKLKEKGVVPLSEEQDDPSKLPDDRILAQQLLEEEGSAPAVKSGFKAADNPSSLSLPSTQKATDQVTEFKSMSSPDSPSQSPRLSPDQIKRGSLGDSKEYRFEVHGIESPEPTKQVLVENEDEGAAVEDLKQVNEEDVEVKEQEVELSKVQDQLLPDQSEEQPKKEEVQDDNKKKSIFSFFSKKKTDSPEKVQEEEEKGKPTSQPEVDDKKDQNLGVDTKQLDQQDENNERVMTNVLSIEPAIIEDEEMADPNPNSSQAEKVVVKSSKPQEQHQQIGVEQGIEDQHAGMQPADDGLAQKGEAQLADDKSPEKAENEPIVEQASESKKKKSLFSFFSKKKDDEEQAKDLNQIDNDEKEKEPEVGGTNIDGQDLEDKENLKHNPEEKAEEEQDHSVKKIRTSMSEFAVGILEDGQQIEVKQDLEEPKAEVDDKEKKADEDNELKVEGEEQKVEEVQVEQKKKSLFSFFQKFKAADQEKEIVNEDSIIQQQDQQLNKTPEQHKLDIDQTPETPKQDMSHSIIESNQKMFESDMVKAGGNQEQPIIEAIQIEPFEQGSQKNQMKLKSSKPPETVQQQDNQIEHEPVVVQEEEPNQQFVEKQDVQVKSKGNNPEKATVQEDAPQVDKKSSNRSSFLSFFKKKAPETKEDQEDEVKQDNADEKEAKSDDKDNNKEEPKRNVKTRGKLRNDFSSDDDEKEVDVQKSPEKTKKVEQKKEKTKSKKIEEIKSQKKEESESPIKEMSKSPEKIPDQEKKEENKSSIFSFLSKYKKEFAKTQKYNDEEISRKLVEIPVYQKYSAQSIFDGEPSTNSKKALETWKKLGPLQAFDVYKSILDHYPEIEEAFQQKARTDDIQFLKDKVDDWGFTLTGTKDTQSNELCGFAQKVWRQGRIQEGFYFDGWFLGESKNVYSNGAAYIGMWNDSKKHGKGKFYYADGSSEEGKWQNGEKQGKFTYVDVKGKKSTRFYKDDELV